MHTRGIKVLLVICTFCIVFKRAGFTEIINKRQERFVKTGEEVEEDMKSNTGKDIDQTLEDVKSTTGKEIGQTIKLTPSSESTVTASENMLSTTQHSFTMADSHSTSSWVIITICVTVGFLIIIIIILTASFRRRTRLKQLKSKQQGLAGMYESELIRPPRARDKEDEISTVSANISKGSIEITDDFELAPLTKITTRERSNFMKEPPFPVRKRFSTETAVQESGDVQSPEMKTITSCVPACNFSLSFMKQCLRPGDEKVYEENYVNSVSLFKSRRDDGNKLRGGNGDFDRRYVDVDYVNNDIGLQRSRCYRQSSINWEDYSLKASRGSSSSSSHHFLNCDINLKTNVRRPAWQQSRNESSTSSSTRSYISIPPTSPSENYIEAGSDNLSMRSERSTPPTKFAWLTKNLKMDAKNEIRNYQSSLGTQTENDGVTAPKSKTVFGTPWQFGGTYTSRGGVLQAENSDVRLVVTANAVPKRDYVYVFGAVFTDTVEIRKKLNFPAREVLITPVVEYHAEPFAAFTQHVCVQLPHSMPQEFDVSLVKVYTFTVDERGKVSLHLVPVLDKSNEDRIMEIYWEKAPDGQSIHISTTHFSGYFCTQCSTSSLPSIMTTVFGSHVQITSSRREVRVILYIWDCRLAIRDYLERFCKQESDFDRQLLIDMRVPLLNNASSESRLVMRMEVKGDDDERQCWRHVSRPGGSGPLFKPLQVRKLEEIIQCCRQTDPVRVEWALESVPKQIPGAVFQCYIDVMHVHESIRDYETAMNENNDDLRRTFYVQDLKIRAHSPEELMPRMGLQLADVKGALLDIINTKQTEDICKAFGVTIKDIENMRTKHSASKELQLGLVEECIKRHGPDKFINQLPRVLERLRLNQILYALEDRKILVRNFADPGYQHEVAAQPKPVVPEAKVPASGENLSEDRDGTKLKSLYQRSPSPHHRRCSSSPERQKRKEDMRGSQRCGLQRQMSQRNDEAFVASSHMQHGQDDHPRISSRESKQSRRQRQHRYSPLPSEYIDDENTICQNVGQNRGSFTDHITKEELSAWYQKSSISGHDSVLSSGSIPTENPVAASDSTATASVHFSSHSTINPSLIAHVDPLDFDEPYPEEFLDDHLQQTYKKETVIQKNMFSPYSTEGYAAYQNPQEQLRLSNSGPHAIPIDSEMNPSSSYHIQPHGKLSSEKRSREKSLSQDKDQTRKKELYNMHTMV